MTELYDLIVTVLFRDSTQKLSECKRLAQQIVDTFRDEGVLFEYRDE